MGNRHSSPWSCLPASTPPGSRLHGTQVMGSVSLNSVQHAVINDAAEPSVSHQWVDGLLTAGISR